MKNHQYAIKPTDDQQIISELKTIHFYKDHFKKLPTNQLFRILLNKTFVTAKSSTFKKLKQTDLMATSQQDVYHYLIQHNQISENVFYNVALQLLHFEVHLDFELNHPLAAMQKIRLPYYKNPGIPLTQLGKHSLSNHELIKSWYLLLNTHTKLGQTYLDDLASNGYLAQYHDLPKPLFINGKSQPVFDTNHLIHETVYVEAPLDTDHDGKRDLLRTDIIRPSETNQGLKIPVLFTASPYNLGTNDESGKKLTHNVNVPLQHKQPNHFTYQDIQSHDDPTVDVPSPRQINGKTQRAEASFHHEWTYTLNDYFLARGFAIVYSAGIGTRDSQGLRTTGSKAETIAAKSIVEWLAGNRTAFTNPRDHVAIKAWWSNHRIAMTGRSYLGTLSTAVASTGVSGLKTVIVEAGIANWYDYYRENGLVVAPGGFQGEDCDVLAEETFSRQKEAGDYHQIKSQWQRQLKKIATGQDRQTGNYNSFWDARNYMKDIHNAKANFLIVHGLNDWNVKPRNAEELWQHLQKLPVTKKLILHQGQHIYINNFQSIDFTDIANLWLSQQLYQQDNNVKKLLPNVIIQDNTQPETWRTYLNWSNSQHHLQFYLHQHELNPQAKSKQPQTFKDDLTPNVFQDYCHHYQHWYRDLLTTKQTPLKKNRLIFRTPHLKHDLKIDGRVQLDLAIKSSQNFGMLSVLLIDYGRARRLTVTPQIISPKAIYQGYQWRKDDLREFKYQKHFTSYKKITEGHINLQNRQNSYRVSNLNANQYVPIQLKLQPTFFHLLKGHQLGLVLYATDFAMTTRGNQHLQYTIDPTRSSLSVPIVK